MTKTHLTIATRKSPLALEQAEIVKNCLQILHPQLVITLLGMTTEGDRRLNVTLNEIGGKGLFVKELEEALLDGRADIAVHSMKDVPMVLPPKLSLPVMLKREDPRDAFVSDHYDSFMMLPPGAKVGTSSLRRQTQLYALRPDITFLNLRGNINTRLAKLDQGDFDAIILASAGLLRMGQGFRIRTFLPIEECLPAAGQGALGIECREGDKEVIELISPLNDAHTSYCVRAERAVCRRLEGGCKVPVAAFAQLHHDELFIRGLVSNKEGSEILRAELKGPAMHDEQLGKVLADDLLAQGAGRILQEFKE